MSTQQTSLFVAPNKGKSSREENKLDIAGLYRVAGDIATVLKKEGLTTADAKRILTLVSSQYGMRLTPVGVSTLNTAPKSATVAKAVATERKIPPVPNKDPVLDSLKSQRLEIVNNLKRENNVDAKAQLVVNLRKTEDEIRTYKGKPRSFSAVVQDIVPQQKLSGHNSDQSTTSLGDNRGFDPPQSYWKKKKSKANKPLNVL